MSIDAMKQAFKNIYGHEPQETSFLWAGFQDGYKTAIEAVEKQEPENFRERLMENARLSNELGYLFPQPAIPDGWQAVVSEFIAAWDGSADPKAVGSTCRFIRAESALRDLIAPKPENSHELS